MENFNHKQPSPFKKILLAGLVTAASIAGYGNSTISENLSKKAEASYNSNKESNDANFNTIFSLDSLPDGEHVSVHAKGKESVIVKVRHTDPATKNSSEEKFTNIEELAQKYPDYANKIKETINFEYQRYVNEVSYSKLEADLEKTLPGKVVNYTPSPGEIAILKQAAELKNAGGSTDGFDEIYHYYIDAFKTPEDSYNFTLKHNATPRQLAEYMVENYYKPLLK